MSTLAKLIGRTEHPKGEIGLEIETEALRAYDYVPAIGDYWSIELDGSLRQNGQEFIFRRPFTPGSKEYKKALELFDAQAKVSKFIDSVYTSVHVHLNMNDKTVTHLANFITLYLIFEEPLTEYCGDTRNGNLFCLKTSNAEASYRNIQELFRAIDQGTGQYFISRLDHNRFKYSGLNIVPLRHLGSVEVRTHPGCNDVALIDRWIQILHMLYKKATTFDNPVAIINRLYGYRSKTAFFELIFEEYSKFFDLNNLDAKMKNGIWYATSAAGCVENWKDFGSKKAKTKKDVGMVYVIDDVVPTDTDAHQTRVNEWIQATLNNRDTAARTVNFNNAPNEVAQPRARATPTATDYIRWGTTEDL